MMSTETPSRRKLLDAALEHLAIERAAACLLRVPDTDPPLFVAVGPAPAIVELLQAEIDVDQAVDAGDITAHARAKRRQALVQREVQFDESEGGHHD